MGFNLVLWVEYIFEIYIMDYSLEFWLQVFAVLLHHSVNSFASELDFKWHHKL